MESAASRIFRVVKTLLQMVKDRDYLVASRDLAQTFEEFVETFGAELSGTALGNCVDAFLNSRALALSSPLRAAALTRTGPG